MARVAFLRLASKAAGVVLLCALAVSFVAAAPVAASARTSGSSRTSVAAPGTKALKRLVREARTLRGPLAKKRLRGFGIRKHRQPGWTPNRTWYRSVDDDQAIQNDTLAAEPADRICIALNEAIETFAPSAESIDPTPLISPRAPRGPPFATAMFSGRRRFRQIEVADAGASRGSEVRSRIRQ